MCGQEERECEDVVKGTCVQEHSDHVEDCLFH